MLLPLFANRGLFWVDIDYQKHNLNRLPSVVLL